MGSYLSIVNDTNDVFHCNVGPDQAALQVFGVVSTVIASIAIICFTAGLAAPALVTAGNIVTIGGFTIATAQVLQAVSIGGTANGLLNIIIAQTTKNLVDQGYREIQPGGREQWGKMTLSLWQQGHCIRHRRVPGQMEIIMDEVYMRPIFSGPVDNSNNDHTIQFWIDKFGFENEQHYVISPPDGQESWGDLDAPFPDTTTAAAAMSFASPIGDEVSYILNATSTGVTLPSDFFTCRLCRWSETGSISFPDAMVSIPNHGTFTCTQIVEAVNNGQIAQDDCILVEQFMGPCGCPLPPWLSAQNPENGLTNAVTANCHCPSAGPGSDLVSDQPSQAPINEEPFRLRKAV